jgi:hypothetical protein
MSDFSDGPDSDDGSTDFDRMDADTSPLAPGERQAFMDKLVAPLDQSEYGKMPASFSQSQRVKPTTVENEVVESSVPENRDQASQTSGTRPAPRPVRAPIIPRNQYDGVVDSDDETDEDEENDEDEEAGPQVVGDIEIDMDAEEEEFLEFSRQALGISDEQWSEIIKNRKERGGEMTRDYPKSPN